METTRCKHGMVEAYCALCKREKEPQSRPRTPIRRKEVRGKSVANGDESSPLPVFRLGTEYVILYAQRRNGNLNPSFDQLSEKTKKVHFATYPFLWAFEVILEKCPNLESIRVIPSFQRATQKNHKKMCQERGISLEVGHDSLNLTWKDEENRSPFYQQQKAFFMNLKDIQRQLFEEAKGLGFEPPLLSSRYFCLEGEPFISQRVLAEMYGYSNGNRGVSERINAMIHYLDPGFKTSKSAKSYARSMSRKIQRINEMLSSSTQFEEYLAGFGVTKLPDNFPLARIEIYSKLLQLAKEGKLEELKRTHSREYTVITSRFGIDGPHKGRYQTLEAIGQQLDGVTREWIRQVEEKAFHILGIDEED